MKEPEIFDYRIYLSTDFDLSHRSEPDDCVKTYMLTVTHQNEESGQPETIAAKLVIHEICQSDDFSLYDICDAHSQEVFNFYISAFDDEDQLKEEIYEALTGIPFLDFYMDRIFVYHACIVAPEFRGRGLGQGVSSKSSARGPCLVLAEPGPIVGLNSSNVLRTGWCRKKT